MTLGFQYHRIANFLELSDIGQEWRSTTQLGLPDSEADDTISTTIRFLGLSDHPHFLKYFVKHETTQNQKVRFENKERNQVIFVEEFHLYIPKNFSYLYAQTKRQISNEMLKRIRSSKDDFVYTNREVDLQEMKTQLMSDIRGGWFRDLDIANVQAAALFGSTVGGSDDWKRYENSGKISALVFELSYKGTQNSVIISHNGGIIVYQNMNENDVLEFVDRINDLVGKFSQEVSIIKPHQDSMKKV